MRLQRAGRTVSVLGPSRKHAVVRSQSPPRRLFCAEAGVDSVAQIELRLVRVELPSGETEVLLTSQLDRQAFPAEVFADLYNRR